MTDLASILAALDAVPTAELPDAIGALEAAKAKAWARLTAPPVDTRVSIDGGEALDVQAVARQAFLYEALVVEKPQDWMGEPSGRAHANAAAYPRACKPSATRSRSRR